MNFHISKTKVIEIKQKKMKDFLIIKYIYFP